MKTVSVEISNKLFAEVSNLVAEGRYSSVEDAMKTIVEQFVEGDRNKKFRVWVVECPEYRSRYTLNKPITEAEFKEKFKLRADSKVKPIRVLYR